MNRYGHALSKNVSDEGCDVSKKKKLPGEPEDSSDEGCWMSVTAALGCRPDSIGCSLWFSTMPGSLQV